MVKKSRRRGVGADGAAGRNETILKAMWKYIRPYLHLALIAALFGAPLWLQLLLFVAVSVGLLAMLRPLVRKYFRPGLSRTNVDAVIGTQGFVTEEIDNVAASGQVKLGAMPWTARSTSGQPIPAGTRVRVDKVEGVKVYVSAAEEPAAV